MDQPLPFILSLVVAFMATCKIDKNTTRTIHVSASSNLGFVLIPSNGSWNVMEAGMVSDLLASDGVVVGCYHGRWREEEELRLWAMMVGCAAEKEENDN